MSNASIPVPQRIGLVFGPVMFALIYLAPQLPHITSDGQKVMALTAWMLIWWITEAMPLPVTALLPLAIFPLLGIKGLTFDKVALPYSNKIIFLFMGGFMIALAMEKWKLHLRIAIRIVKLTGTSANGIILGFILATGFLSAWISNTATAVMMLPVALSVVKLLADRAEEKAEENKEPRLSGVPAKKVDQKGAKRFALVLMLSIAYAANIGGLATLIGTPPNLVFSSYIETQYHIEVGFLEWSKWAAPVSLLLLLITYWMLTYIIFPNGIGKFEGAEELIETEWKKLGKLQGGELYILIIFISTALAWIFREPISKLIPGLSDYNIAMLAGVAVFCLPVQWRKGKFLLSWEDTEKMPWGILLLFGGGLCLADRLEEVGLIALVGHIVAQMEGVSLLVLLGAMMLFVIFLSELLSNVALITVFMPVVGGIAAGTGYDLIILAMPIAMAGSTAFMLPMGTPPNAIVFASGHIKFAEMSYVGFWLNLISAAVLLGLGALMAWLGTGIQ